VNPLLLTFYGDDFTGSTDALEQLTAAGIRTVLFMDPPTPKQLARFPGLQALGVAGKTRSLAPDAMQRELRPALKKLKALGARHVHYKVCSTFDSSPTVGSIGRVIDVATKIFRAPFVPLLVAAPALGRYCVFGNLFARFGIGSNGAIHRLDRHPSVSRHPITPMQEADLRLHLARQTKKRIALFDILNLELPAAEARAALKRTIADGAQIVLFDALRRQQLRRIGELIDGYATGNRPLFSVGSSGIEAALAAHWRPSRNVAPDVRRLRSESKESPPVLVACGSCSPVTAGQIRWALRHGFVETRLDTKALASKGRRQAALQYAAGAVARHLVKGRSVIVHTHCGASDERVAPGKSNSRGRSRTGSAQIFGDALAWICREAIAQTTVRRLCIAGGDTSSYAARALGIEALEMISPLTPGAPLCRVHAPGSPVHGFEVVFKGGQVGAENYFETVRRGMP
jgi:3-oxoisoapionate kinase